LHSVQDNEFELRPLAHVIGTPAGQALGVM